MDLFLLAGADTADVVAGSGVAVGVLIAGCVAVWRELLRTRAEHRKTMKEMSDRLTLLEEKITQHAVAEADCKGQLKVANKNIGDLQKQVRARDKRIETLEHEVELLEHEVAALTRKSVDLSK